MTPLGLLNAIEKRARLRIGVLALIASLVITWELTRGTATLNSIASALPPADAHFAYYADDDKEISYFNTRLEAVFIGDSITQRWQAHGASSWDDHWLNRGIGGERSDQVRARFAQDAVNLHPQTVVILVGTNDAWVNRPDLPLSATERNIGDMETQARREGIHVVLASVPPIGPRVTAPGLPMPPHVNTRIEAQNAWERDYAARNGDGFADYWGVMRPELTIDGVHPSAAGYAAMAPVAAAAITAR